MRMWIHFFSQLRRNERDFVTHSHTHGYVGMELTPILFLIICILYILTPYDLIPEMWLGGIGLLDDVIITILICIYNNPIEVISKLIFGRKPGGLILGTKPIYMEQPASQIMDRIPEVMQETSVDTSNETSVEDSIYNECSIPGNEEFQRADIGVEIPADVSAAINDIFDGRGYK